MAPGEDPEPRESRGAERAAMNVSSRRQRWTRTLALIGLGIALTSGLIAAWLLPAPTKAAERIIAGEPEGRTIYTSSIDARLAQWIGPAEWDARFLGSGTL